MVLALSQCLVASTSASAQVMTGRVTSGVEGAPVPDALVVLLDSADQQVRRTSTMASGSFRFFSLAEGWYRIKVLRIGFGPWYSDRVLLHSNQPTADLRLELTNEPLSLTQDIVFRGSGSCRTVAGGAEVTALLIEEARKTFALAEETMYGHSLRFRSSTWSRRTDSRGMVVEEGTRKNQLWDWPIESAPLDTLARWGFVRPASGQERASGLGPRYYGPDGSVLFSDWFLSSHCFSLLELSEEAGEIGLAFEPLEGINQPDIAGELWWNSESLALGRLEFHYVGLPDWMPVGSAGGRLEFFQLPASGWIVSHWEMKVPIERRNLGSGRSTVDGFLSTGGLVTEVTSRRGATVWTIENRED